jgi:multidrug efflux pump
MTERYQASLARFVQRPWIAVGLLLATALGGAGLYSVLPSEYAPAEDRNMMLMMMRAPEGATPGYMDRQVQLVEAAVMPYVEDGDIKRVVARTGMWGAGGDINTAFIYMPLESRTVRERSAQELSAEIRGQVSQFPGAISTVFLPPSLAIRSAGSGLALVLSGTTYEQLTAWQDEIIAKVAADNPKILGMRSARGSSRPSWTGARSTTLCSRALRGTGRHRPTWRTSMCGPSAPGSWCPSPTWSSSRKSLARRSLSASTSSAPSR